ncbi:MAG: 6-carboxytetrahydropterin synthase QueD [Bacteroidetes bacterium HGW-Bacteroidetes-21]|jgi:6-pyruvoyltetrahydropterin/6-carboxytetrahydropterin synthase|nr:MAG: 6-carboxytetrahydropterin synthase QueD [Bacteroidetes bacterium HGW-Bacteroidetes-21]
MAKIRLTKEFRWEMAHALWNYDGLCKNIHGHSYILQVTVIGEPISDPNSKKLGMVIDFGDLKKIVNKVIVDIMDHSLVISDKSEHSHLLELKEMFDRRHITNYQPTCENMIADFAQRIIPLLPQEVGLFSLRLYETATAWADWYASDNQ